MAITEDPDNFNIIQCYIIIISLYNLEIKQPITTYFLPSLNMLPVKIRISLM
jgi:hypothetical protein